MAVWAHVCGYRFTQSVFCFFKLYCEADAEGRGSSSTTPPRVVIRFQCAINWPEGWSEPRHLEPWERVLHADAECRCSSTPSPSSGGHSFPMYSKMFSNHEVMSYTLHSSCRNLTPPSSRCLQFFTFLSNRSSVLYIPSRVRRVNRRIRSEFTLFRSAHRCPDDGLETSCGKRFICGRNLSENVMARYWRGRNYRSGNVRVISNLQRSALFRVFILYTHTHTLHVG